MSSTRSVLQNDQMFIFLYYFVMAAHLPQCTTYSNVSSPFQLHFLVLFFSFIWRLFETSAPSVGQISFCLFSCVLPWSCICTLLFLNFNICRISLIENNSVEGVVNFRIVLIMFSNLDQICNWDVTFQGCRFLDYDWKIPSWIVEYSISEARHCLRISCCFQRQSTITGFYCIKIIQSLECFKTPWSFVQCSIIYYYLVIA